MADRRTKVIEDATSALGQEQTFGPFIAMSALPPKADIVRGGENVRFVPNSDIVKLASA